MKKFSIFIDGGSRGNPGEAAVGFVICNEKGQILKRGAERIGKATNNEAEYRAFLASLKKFKALYGKKICQQADIVLHSDSALLVKQLKGEYKIENPELQQLFLDSWNLKIDFPHLSLKQVPREKNKEADRLVNEALDGGSPGELGI